MEEFTPKQAARQEDVILNAGDKMTLQPLRREDQIAMEQSDNEIANAHVNGPAIGNFGSDIEATGEAPEAQISTAAENHAAHLRALRAKAQSQHSKKVPISVVVVIILIAAIGLTFMIKKKVLPGVLILALSLMCILGNLGAGIYVLTALLLGLAVDKWLDVSLKNMEKKLKKQKEKMTAKPAE